MNNNSEGTWENRFFACCKTGGGIQISKIVIPTWLYKFIQIVNNNLAKEKNEISKLVERRGTPENWYFAYYKKGGGIQISKMVI